MSVVTIEHVTKKFGDTVVLTEFNDEFGDGEFVTLLGPSGCGKTTMLRMIAGFEKPSSGVIRIDGRTVSGEGVFVPPEERGIGMVFQSYAVWPHMNVFDNVAYPLKIRNVPKKEIKERVDDILKNVHLEQYRDRMPSELSGGQQQRVALGRALASDSKLLLLDEPLSNLDAKLREKMRFEIKEIQQKYRITVVYVTHDQSEAMTMSDRVFVINAGVVQQVGSPIEIYRSPANLFVADFVGKVNVLEGTAEDLSPDAAAGDLVNGDASSGAIARGMIRLDGIGEILPYGGDLRGQVEVVIRPENIRIVRGEAHLRGKIISEYFMGDSNDCIVRTGDKVLRVIADADTYHSFAPGEEIGIEIKDFLVFPRAEEEYRKILT